MKKQMVECEDGRTRQARVFGVEKEEGVFKVMQASVRIKGRHVAGEAWINQKNGITYFLTSPEAKHEHLLPRKNKYPSVSSSSILRSPTIRST